MTREELTFVKRALLALVPWPFVVGLTCAVALLLLPRATENALILAATVFACFGLVSFGAAAIGHTLDVVRGRAVLEVD